MTTRWLSSLQTMVIKFYYSLLIKINPLLWQQLYKYDNLDANINTGITNESPPIAIKENVPPEIDIDSQPHNHNAKLTQPLQNDNQVLVQTFFKDEQTFMNPSKNNKEIDGQTTFTGN